LNINEGIAYRKIIGCINVTKMKTTGKYLFETKCKWETKGWGAVLPEVSWKLKCKMRKQIESRHSIGAVLVVSVATVIVCELT
jgi:hypothetical protein